MGVVGAVADRLLEARELGYGGDGLVVVECGFVDFGG